MAHPQIAIFARLANGNAETARRIEGNKTLLGRTQHSIRHNSIHDELIVTNPWAGAVLTFPGDAVGETPPIRIIRGPKTGLSELEQMQVYPPRGWVLVTQTSDSSFQEPKDTFVGVWSIRDHGDVPPRWKIGGGKSTIKKPRGIALNPKNKEVIVADMRLNAVLTFYFPELF